MKTTIQVLLTSLGLIGIWYVILFHVLGCTENKCPVYYNWDYLAEYYNMTPAFDTLFDTVTPTGVRIDGSIESGLVDVIIDRIEACMYRHFGVENNGLVIPQDVRRAAYCTTARPAYPVDRACVRVKMPNEGAGWHWSPCSRQQLLDWTTPDFSACADKGIEYRGCPCSWRSGVQDDGVIVTTPNLYVFPDWFIRIHFGCLNPWGHSSTAECARPQTTIEGELL